VVAAQRILKSAIACSRVAEYPRLWADGGISRRYCSDQGAILGTISRWSVWARSIRWRWRERNGGHMWWPPRVRWVQTTNIIS